MHLTRVFSYDRALSGLVQASPAYLYDFLHKSNEKHKKSWELLVTNSDFCSLFHTLQASKNRIGNK